MLYDLHCTRLAAAKLYINYKSKCVPVTYCMPLICSTMWLQSLASMTWNNNDDVPGAAMFNIFRILSTSASVMWSYVKHDCIRAHTPWTPSFVSEGTWLQVLQREPCRCCRVLVYFGMYSLFVRRTGSFLESHWRKQLKIVQQFSSVKGDWVHRRPF